MSLILSSRHYLNFHSTFSGKAQIDGYPVLRAMEAQLGLIVERAQDVYSFSHQSLLEYFAACDVKVNADEGVLNRERLLLPEHLIDDRWREVLLNVAAMGKANGLLWGMLDGADALLGGDAKLLSIFVWVSQMHDRDPQSYPPRTLQAKLVPIRGSSGWCK